MAEIPGHFVLYGGTALALRLGHRTSEDFDFFGNLPFQPDELEQHLPFLAGSTRLQSAPNTLTSLVERGGPVKLSFFGGLTLRRVAEPDVAHDNGIRIASLLDLAATKVRVVQDRAEAKDYLDLARLLEEGMGLAAALGAARAVFGEAFNPILSLKALCYFQDGDLPSLPRSVRDRLARAVEAVQPASLPQFDPLPGGLSP